MTSLVTNSETVSLLRRNGSGTQLLEPATNFVNSEKNSNSGDIGGSSQLVQSHFNVPMPQQDHPNGSGPTLPNNLTIHLW